MINQEEASVLTAAKAITPNEGRAMLGLEPLAGGDDFDGGVAAKEVRGS